MALNDHQSTIRRYLLRQLTDDAQERIEQRLLTEEDVFEEVEIAEDELIDEYLAETLSQEERQTFERDFLANPERRQKLRFAKALRRQASAASQKKGLIEQDKASPWIWWRQYFAPSSLSDSPLAMAAVLLIVVGLGFAVWRGFFYQSDVDKGLVALNAAYRQQRPTEARITELNYAPFLRTRGGTTNNVNEAERQRAELTLLDALNKKPTPAVQHALGRVYLAKNDFDAAIKQFEAALKADPGNAQIYADLGAAYLERGKIEIERAQSNREGSESGKGLEDFSRSLENLNRALELNPNLLEARFNRALCFELQSLPLRAEEEWREYLKKDSNSLWADEARRRLHLLEEQKSKTSQTKENLLQEFLKAFEARDDETAWLIISQHRDVSGGAIENTLIDNYLELVTSGRREESLKAFDILSYAGELERERAGDLFIPDLVGFFRSISDSQRNSLVAARALMKTGRENLIGSKLEVAVHYYSRAKETFEQIGDPGEALYAEYPLGHSYLLQAKSELSLATFQRVAGLCEMRQYKWLLAQTLNAIANVQIGLTNYSEALDASHRSLELSKQIGDTTGVIKTTNQLAQQYFRLGNYRKSLDLHQQSLTLANLTLPEPMQSWRNYFSIAMPLNAMGLHSAAIEYELEALRRAQEMKAPQLICRSYTLLGLMHAGRDDYVEAIKNLDMALELGKKIASDTAQKESIAYSSLQLGLLYRQTGDLNKSIENYDHALQLYGELDNFEAFSYVAHKGKLLSCMRQEGCTSVEEEIKTCLDLFEKYRLKILEQSNRDSFFDTEQNIYDVAIEYEFSRKKDFQTAFGYSERARSRSLLDFASSEAKLVGGEANPDIKFNSAKAAHSFEQIKAELPSDAQVLQYAVLEDRLLIWLISDTEFAHEEKVISLADLNAKLIAYLKLISSPSENDLDDLTRDGMALYDILIKPIEVSLRKDKLLCIVPDKILNYLPFAALVSTHSARYLVDEYKVISAPSSSMFIRSSYLASKKKTESETLLAVGNPRFSRDQFPLLADLPSAAKEVREIRTYYGKSSRTLVGEGATKRQVEAEMRRSDVLHLAMHSVVDEETPLRSKLIFATDARRDLPKDRDSILYAYEIYDSSLPLAHLVVLSACDTGVGRYYRGEGMMGLSRTFIAAGVPLVVASLWPVDSDSTADLMIAFHRYRKTENLSSADALQKAQRTMADGADRRYRHPYYWAAFTLVGGSATF